MSKAFGFVGEGKTDFSVFEAALMALPGGSACTATQIQPPFDQLSSSDDQGEHGGGWRAVLRWCDGRRQSGPDPLESTVLSNFDTVVIHIDADFAVEQNLAEICFDASGSSAQEMNATIACYLEWLLERNCGDNQSEVVFMIPSMATEAWIIASGIIQGFPSPQDIEHVSEPATMLYGKQPKFVRMHGGDLKKIAKTYEIARAFLAANWPKVSAKCGTARVFWGHLAKCVGTPSG